MQNREGQMRQRSRYGDEVPKGSNTKTPKLTSATTPIISHSTSFTPSSTTSSTTSSSCNRREDRRASTARTVGRLEWADGCKYEGDWSGTNRHRGHGVYIWADGDRYEGEWRDGRPHGVGTYYWKEGDRYYGQWRHGCKHGMGIYIYADGSMKKGEWLDDFSHGEAVFVDRRNRRHVRMYNEGRLDASSSSTKAKSTHVPANAATSTSMEAPHQIRHGNTHDALHRKDRSSRDSRVQRRLSKSVNDGVDEEMLRWRKEERERLLKEVRKEVDEKLLSRANGGSKRESKSSSDASLDSADSSPSTSRHEDDEIDDSNRSDANDQDRNVEFVLLQKTTELKECVNNEVKKVKTEKKEEDEEDWIRNSKTVSAIWAELQVLRRQLLNQRKELDEKDKAIRDLQRQVTELNSGDKKTQSTSSSSISVVATPKENASVNTKLRNKTPVKTPTTRTKTTDSRNDQKKAAATKVTRADASSITTPKTTAARRPLQPNSKLNRTDGNITTIPQPNATPVQKTFAVVATPTTTTTAIAASVPKMTPKPTSGRIRKKAMVIVTPSAAVTATRTTRVQLVSLRTPK